MPVLYANNVSLNVYAMFRLCMPCRSSNINEIVHIEKDDYWPFGQYEYVLKLWWNSGFCCMELPVAITHVAKSYCVSSNVIANRNDEKCAWQASKGQRVCIFHLSAGVTRNIYFVENDLQSICKIWAKIKAGRYFWQSKKLLSHNRMCFVVYFLIPLLYFVNIRSNIIKSCSQRSRQQH